MAKKTEVNPNERKPTGSVEKLIERGLTRLVLNEPFFSSLILQWRIEDDLTMPFVMATDGRHLFYNSAMLTSFERKVDTVVQILCHEVLHVALMHHLRRGGRHPMIWNLAGDYVVNAILKASPIGMPEFGLYDKRFEGMDVYEVYAILEQEIPIIEIDLSREGEGDDEGKGHGQGKDGKPIKGTEFGGVYDSPAKDKALEEEMLKVQITQALEVAKRRGKVPAHLDRSLSEVLESRIPWREVLARYLHETIKNDYSWKKTNRRYLQQGICLPVIEEPTLGEIVLGVDTSGSIGGKELQMIGGWIRDILSQYNTTLHTVYCDASVQGVQVFDSSDASDFKMESKGGGGTYFSPVFKWTDEQGLMPTLLIYMTDGYCDDFPPEPPYHTIWALTGKNHNWNPPFGDTIVCMDD